MKKIFIGIPSIRRFEPFWESYKKFVVNAREFYEIESMVVTDKSLGIAQNIIADCFLDGNCEYLLFLDDDHWGHTVQMLDCLIDANSHVATMKTYSRHFPYACTLIQKTKGGLIPIEHADGYREVDLTGFPMTLIRRDTFALLDRPYFREVEFCGRTWNTDEDFFERLNTKGIKPIGCFQYCLNHDIITPENVVKLRLQKTRELVMGRSI